MTGEMRAVAVQMLPTMEEVFERLRADVDNDDRLDTGQKRVLTDAVAVVKQLQAVTLLFKPLLPNQEDAEDDRFCAREKDLRGIAAHLMQAHLHAFATWGEPLADSVRSWVLVWSFQSFTPPDAEETEV